MRVIVTVRGTMKAKDEQEAQKAHDTTFNRLSPIGRSLGSVGHAAYLNPQNRRQFLAVDSWPNLESLQAFMSHPANPGAAIAGLFEGQPDIAVWVETGWAGF
ncbi:MAG TPA: hypothetical protein VGR25_07080 [bacterium]|nr:hypothetical protein [bacterium]